MERSEIENLNKNWVESNHLLTHPKGYNKLGLERREEHVTQRKQDLIKLLWIIFDYTHQTDNIEYFKSLKDDNLDSFNKYVRTRVIHYFPFEEEVFSIEYVHRYIEDSKFKTWLLNIFEISGNNVSWKPKLDLNVKSEGILKIRFKRLQLLSKICCFLDEIQTNDYLSNNITILKEKGKISGDTNKLVYGDKHVLSAYLGQHIVRMFPFKDFNHFKSEELVNNSGGKCIYEHFTPMSFFRDLIWFKPKSLNSNLFDENSRSYNEFEWLSILWYGYRTIYITNKQDKEELNKVNKCRRLFSCYDDLGIKIDNRKVWDHYHSINSLMDQLK